MSRNQIIIACLLLAALSGIAWFVDPFLVSALRIFFLIGCVPCLIVGTIRIENSRAKNMPLQSAVALTVGAILFGGCAWLMGVANGWVFDREERAAKAYPAQIKPLLEEHRLKHGGYPQSLDELPEKPPVPRLLRKSYGYKSDGKTYSFCFGKPGGLIDTWDYNGETGEWHLST